VAFFWWKIEKRKKKIEQSNLCSPDLCPSLHFVPCSFVHIRDHTESVFYSVEKMYETTSEDNRNELVEDFTNAFVQIALSSDLVAKGYSVQPYAILLTRHEHSPFLAHLGHSLHAWWAFLSCFLSFFCALDCRTRLSSRCARSWYPRWSNFWPSHELRRRTALISSLMRRHLPASSNSGWFLRLVNSSFSFSFFLLSSCLPRRRGCSCLDRRLTFLLLWIEIRCSDHHHQSA